MNHETQFLGQTETLRVYARGDFAVGVNPTLNLIQRFGSVYDVTEGQELQGGVVDATELAFADEAITLATERASAKTGRRYTVPKALRASAASLDREGLTPADQIRAHMLSTFDQVTLPQAQFMDASDLLEEDKRRWIDAINRAEGVEEIPQTEHVFDPESEVFEYVSRLRGGELDRLYRIWADGTIDVYTGQDSWSGAMGDIWEVDDLFDEVAGIDAEDMTTHVPLDPETAEALRTHLDTKFWEGFDLGDDPDEEYVLAEEAYDEVMGDPIVAAAPHTSNAEAYDAEERSKNAAKQVRDKNGKFAKQGSRVVIGGNVKDGAGSITRLIPETGQVRVRLDSGEEIDVDGKLIESEDIYKTLNPVPQAVNTPAYPVQGIFGQKREVVKPFIANLPDNITPMEPSELKNLLDEYPGWVAAQRATNPAARTGDAIEHPLLKKWYGHDKRQEETQAAIRASGEAGESDLRSRITARGDEAPAAPAEEAPAAAEPATDEPPSDVQPIYMAFVDAENLRAVTKLIAIVPASAESTTPTVFQRKGAQWIPDPEAMTDLNSTTPPPVVPLDSTVLNDVLLQVDASNGSDMAEEPVAASGSNVIVDGSITATDIGIGVITSNQISSEVIDHVEIGKSFTGEISSDYIKTDSLIAAGGLDRNRGGAEKLRRYWTYGPGGAKIAWGTPGDWRRCRRYLAKYLGPRAAGYCQLRHKEMTGMWTGDKKHRARFAALEEAIVAGAYERAADAWHKSQEAPKKAEEVSTAGANFIIPLVIPEDTPSGDNRTLEKGSLTHRDLPIPLLWQFRTKEGHDESLIVGRIDSIERVENGLGNARGVFDTSEWAREAERMVRDKFLRGVSADLDDFEATSEFDTDEEGEDIPGTEKIIIKKARIMAATLVAKPAFQECFIQLEDDVDLADESALVACGYIAGEIPVTPPRDWFENPYLSGPTPLTVTEDGKVFGHIALWKTEHIGSRAVKPPRSRTNYSYFHTGTLRTTEGDINVGQLTLAGGHAGLSASAQDAVKHYDDTKSAAADVRAGEDRFGIWVSGALRPDMDALKVRQFRAAAPSGDWRPIDGNLELVAVTQVNVPGFPIARALVASGGEMTALVAAGVAPLVEMRNRLDQMDPRAAEAIRKFNVARQERYEALVASAHQAVTRFEALSEFKYVSREKRDAMAAEGKALPDGSFPIETVADLERAVKAYGRAKNKAAAKRHIRKRAKALGATDSLPDAWKSMSAAIEEDTLSVRERLAQFAERENDDNRITRTVKFTPETQPRDWRGRYRRVLARLKEDLGPRMSEEIEKKIDETSRFDLLGDYMQSTEHALELMKALDSIRGDDLDSASLREASRDLGLTISNLPLPFDNQAQKIRFSDLPQVLKDLIEHSIDLSKHMESNPGVKAAADELRSFIAGGDLYSQSDISERMARMMNLIFADNPAEAEDTVEVPEPQQEPTNVPEEKDEDDK